MSQVPPPPPPYPQGPYGQAPAHATGTYALPPQRQTSVAAVVSLISGILSCIPLVGLIAVVCGIVGIKATSNPRYTGKGLAIAGLVLGLISLAVWGLMRGTIFAALGLTRPMRQASNQFMRHLAGGNVTAAQAMCSNSVTGEELQSAADALRALGTFQDTTMPVSSRQNVNGVQTAEAVGVATFGTAGNLPYAVRFSWQGGSMKVDGFYLIASEGKIITGGVAPKTKPGGS